MGEQVPCGGFREIPTRPQKLRMKLKDFSWRWRRAWHTGHVGGGPRERAHQAGGEETGEDCPQGPLLGSRRSPQQT